MINEVGMVVKTRHQATQIFHEPVIQEKDKTEMPSIKLLSR